MPFLPLLSFQYIPLLTLPSLYFSSPYIATIFPVVVGGILGVSTPSMSFPKLDTFLSLTSCRSTLHKCHRSSPSASRHRLSPRLDTALRNDGIFCSPRIQSVCPTWHFHIVHDPTRGELCILTNILSDGGTLSRSA